jgi:hypothetical protein
MVAFPNVGNVVSKSEENLEICRQIGQSLRPRPDTQTSILLSDQNMITDAKRGFHRFSNRCLVPHSAAVPPLNSALLKSVFSRLFMPLHFLNPDSRNLYPVAPPFYRRPGEYVGHPQTGVAAVDPPLSRATIA